MAFIGSSSSVKQSFSIPFAEIRVPAAARRPDPYVLITPSALCLLSDNNFFILRKTCVTI